MEVLFVLEPPFFHVICTHGQTTNAAVAAAAVVLLWPLGTDSSED